MNRGIVWAVAANELKQVVRSRYYLLPLGALGLLFFFFVPVFLLGAVTNVSGNEAAEAVGAGSGSGGARPWRRVHSAGWYSCWPSPRR